MRVRFTVLGGAVSAVLAGLIAIPATVSTAATAVAAPAASPYASSGGIGFGQHGAATSTLSAASYAAAAASAPTVIGVDDTPPPGKNWEYTHYFPESNVNVPQGGVVLFQWNQGSLNGLHTVTLVPNNETVAQARAAYPTLAPVAGKTAIPPQSVNPTDPNCSTGPTAPPCTFGGTSVLNSGVIPTGTGAAFAVQIAATTAPGTYHYICLIHPGMEGTLNVVAAGQPASDPGALATQAASELAGLNAGAFAAEAAAQTPTFSANADGTKTWNVKVGMTVDDVELLEYLPANVPIHKGDSINFDASGTTQEPHTVTTPTEQNIPFGADDCISTTTGAVVGTADPNSPPSSACPAGSQEDQPLNLAPDGPSVLPTLFTPVERVITGRPDANAAGIPSSTKLTFSNNGTYVFFCVFHQNMGVVVSTGGYRLGGSDGSVYTEGNVDFAGAGAADTSPVVAEPGTTSGQGYWTVTADGHTKAFGDAGDVGNVPVKVASPIVGAVATIDGHGLYLVAKDGGVFALGDAQFMGSMGGKHLNAPMVGITTDTNDSGYDLVASDGGVFSFGTGASSGGPGGGGPPAPRFFGSMGGKHLNSPIVGIADVSDDSGYIMVAADGGVFTFGSAAFKGSLGAMHIDSPIVGIALTLDAPSINSTTPGYRLVSAAGGVYTFGASFAGSVAGTKISSPIVGISGNSP